MGWRDVVRFFPAMHPSPESLPTIIALTGFMAAGKSTGGRGLAGVLKWQFFFMDWEILRSAQTSIREIFAQRGEAAFRDMESESLRRVVQDAEASTIVALGGGTFVHAHNADFLREAGVRVVFLDLPLEQLLLRCRAMGERCGENPRPLAEDEEAFCALYAQRLPFYRKADLVVNADGKTPERIAHE